MLFNLAGQCSSGNASEMSEGPFRNCDETAQVAVRPLHEPVHGICMIGGSISPQDYRIRCPTLIGVGTIPIACINIRYGPETSRISTAQLIVNKR